MFCSNCGTENEALNTRYCVKCGRGLQGSNAAFQKGIKQGLMLLMIGALLIPIWGFIGVAFPPDDRLVESAPSTTMAEAIAWILMWMAFIAAAARMGYAVLFQRNVSPEIADGTDSALRDRSTRHTELPSADSFEPAAAGKWRTSSELKVPAGFRQHPSGEL
jgi:hypothetical protein